MDEKATTNKATNVELKVTRLGTLEVVLLHYEIRKLGLTGEHEEGDKIEWNKKTRFMCLNDWH